MKNYEKIKDHDISNIGMWIEYMDRQCHKNYLKMSLNGLKMFLNLMKIS